MYCGVCVSLRNFLEPILSCVELSTDGTHHRHIPYSKRKWERERFFIAISLCVHNVKMCKRKMKYASCSCFRNKIKQTNALYTHGKEWRVYESERVKLRAIHTLVYEGHCCIRQIGKRCCDAKLFDFIIFSSNKIVKMTGATCFMPLYMHDNNGFLVEK